MISNLEEGELTPSPTDKNPPMYKKRRNNSNNTMPHADIDDDPELNHLFQAAYNTLPNNNDGRKDNDHASSIGQTSSDTNYTHVGKKKKNRLNKSASQTSQGVISHQKNTATVRSLNNNSNKRRRDVSNNSDSGRNNKKARIDNVRMFSNQNKPRLPRKPSRPRMSSSLSSEVSRFYNTSKRMQYLFDLPNNNFIEGIGEFNSEDSFETVWDLTVDELQIFDKRMKELHMQTTLAEVMVQEQALSEKKLKKDLVDAQAKHMKNISSSDMISGHVKLPQKLHEAAMKHNCCVRVLEDLKEQYTLKFNKYQALASGFKKFTTFHKNLLEYKKEYDIYIDELRFYEQKMDEYRIQMEREAIYEEEEKSYIGNQSDVSNHSSDMSLCSHNSFYPPPSPPNINRDNYQEYVGEDPLPTLTSALLDFSQFPTGTSLIRSFGPSSPDLRIRTPDSSKKTKSPETKKNSYTSLSEVQSVNLPQYCSPEVVGEFSKSQNSVPALQNTLKEGNTLHVRTGSWANMQNYAKNSNNVSNGDSRNRQINNISSSQQHLGLNCDTTNGSLSFSTRDKENKMNPAMVAKLHSTVQDIEHIMCYYDVYGICNDKNCTDLHKKDKQLVRDCVEYCLRSEEVLNGLPIPPDETLAYFVFTTLKENNYNYDETINRLYNLVNNG